MVGNKNGTGHVKTQETRKRISKSRLERKSKVGYLNSVEARLKMSEARLGKSPWNKGTGINDYGYPTEFNRKLKLKIRARDMFTCQNCGISEDEHKLLKGKSLVIHHIDYVKTNCHESNLITLCHRCNLVVNANRKDWMEFFNGKLNDYNQEPNLSVQGVKE